MRTKRVYGIGWLFMSLRSVTSAGKEATSINHMYRWFHLGLSEKSFRIGICYELILYWYLDTYTFSLHISSEQNLEI